MAELPAPGRLDALIRNRNTDLFLAGFIVAIVGMLLIPLPTWAMDLLLTVNICAAVTVLMVSLYIRDVTAITTLPTLLLITTLYRLSLNVSTSRLIISQGDAGEVVRAFGSFVAAGDLVVGVVVFLIITVVQFVVIAKGSERVAEVAARFALDAMPQKQMAIDLDLKSGMIDAHEAVKRRERIQRESQIYGAMDGAMKFVKGDAIVGILITIINIVGGLSIGILREGMSAGEAADLYTLLTIGDGLVSQIPALLISVTSGIVVTRVSAERKSQHLAQNISEQTLAYPRAIAIVAALLAALAFVPGLPTFPFLIASILSGGTAFVLLRKGGGVDDAEDEEAAEAAARAADDGDGNWQPPTPFSIELSSDLASLVDGSTPEGETFQGRMNEVRALLFDAYGVIVPEIAYRPRPDLPERTVGILLNDVTVRQLTLPDDRVMIAQPPDQLAIFQLQAEPFAHPITGRPASLVPTEEGAIARQAQFDVFDTADLLRLHVHGYAAQNLHEFVDLQTTQALVNALSETHGDLVAAVTPKPVRLSEVTELLKRLLREQVSIRDLARILEAAGKWRIAQPQVTGLDLAELVRSDLGRRICQRALASGGRLPVCLVDAEIEETIVASILHTETGPELGISNEDLDAVMEAIRQALGRVPSHAGLPAVLCTNPRCRPFLRILVAQEFPDALVLSARELSGAPEIRPEPAGVIRTAPVVQATA